MLLVLIVLETAANPAACTTQKDGKQSLAPIAIGLTVFLAHVFLIPITVRPSRKQARETGAHAKDGAAIDSIPACT